MPKRKLVYTLPRDLHQGTEQSNHHSTGPSFASSTKTAQTKTQLPQQLHSHNRGGHNPRENKNLPCCAKIKNFCPVTDTVKE